MVLLPALGMSADPRESEAGFAEACVSMASPCDYGLSAWDWATRQGSDNFGGGAEIRANARSSAQSVGARAFAKTVLGGGHTIVSGASAFYSDSKIKVVAPGQDTVLVTWNVYLSGEMIGGDSGPPCEHCGGQSPWTSTGKTTLSYDLYNGVTKVDTVDLVIEWDSNNLYKEPVITTGTVELTAASGDTIGWSLEITVRAVAQNKPCTSGQGQCDNPGGAVIDADYYNTATLGNFRAFDAESGEEIFDFSVTGGDGIDYLAISRGCGNGTLDEGEACDDFNVRPGDCCSESCQLEGDACMIGDCGDVDDSGEIIASDALLALQASVGIAECSFCRCDANDSQTVSVADALRILHAAVGGVVPLNCQPCA